MFNLSDRFFRTYLATYLPTYLPHKPPNLAHHYWHRLDQLIRTRRNEIIQNLGRHLQRLTVQDGRSGPLHRPSSRLENKKEPPMDSPSRPTRRATACSLEVGAGRSVLAVA